MSTAATATPKETVVVVDPATVAADTPDLKMQLFVNKVPQLMDAAELSAIGFMYTPMSNDARDGFKPETGMVIFNTTTSKLNVYTAAGWEEVSSALVGAARSKKAAAAPVVPATDDVKKEHKDVAHAAPTSTHTPTHK